MRLYFFLLFFTFIGFIKNSAAQNEADLNEEKIRVSGIVVDENTNEPVPYAAVYIKGTLYGTVTDEDGFFTILANPTDTLVFAEDGYATSYSIIPVEMKDTEFSLVERMRADERYIPELSVYPWQDLTNFQFDNLGGKLKDDVFIQSMDQGRRLRNIFQEQYHREWIYYQGFENQRFYRLNLDIFRPNNFLNPYYWVGFINDWGLGLYNDQYIDLDMYTWQWYVIY